MIKCPVCNQPLSKKENHFICQDNHQFDMNKRGIVNLLMSQKKSTKQHGDDKKMVDARNEFLNEGHYDILVASLTKNIQGIMGNALDIGCGEGYYTHALHKSNPHLNIVGVDISKDALNRASRQNNPVQYIVASNYHLPILDESIDVAWSLFAPFNDEEVKRILKSKGLFLHVYPLKNHLLELKEAMYDTVYLNKVPDTIQDLTLIETQEVTKTLELSEDSLQNLVNMTPYTYRTHPSRLEKLKGISPFRVTIGFGIRLYRKGE